MEEVRNHDLDGVTKTLQGNLEGKKMTENKKALDLQGLF